MHPVGTQDATFLELKNSIHVHAHNIALHTQAPGHGNGFVTDSPQNSSKHSLVCNQVLRRTRFCATRIGSMTQHTSHLHNNHHFAVLRKHSINQYRSIDCIPLRALPSSSFIVCKLVATCSQRAWAHIRFQKNNAREFWTARAGFQSNPLECSTYTTTLEW